MTKVPHFSVLIPAYNAEATLAQSVESVIAQTFSDWEIVIVDDGSTDSTKSIAERFASNDARIRLISQTNRGSGGAYNTGVLNARADLMVMLSADDLLLPTHLEEFAVFIQANPGAAIFTCDGFYEYPDGSREQVKPQVAWTDANTCSLTDLLSSCFFGVGAVYHREVFTSVGGFKEDMYAEDYLFWLMASAHGFMHRFLDRPLAVHRRLAEQKSDNALLMRRTDLEAIEQVIDTGLLGPKELEVAQKSVKRLRRNIRTRRTLSSVMGSKLTEQLIERTRAPRVPLDE